MRLSFSVNVGNAVDLFHFSLSHFAASGTSSIIPRGLCFAVIYSRLSAGELKNRPDAVGENVKAVPCAGDETGFTVIGEKYY
jgi:hypothetical protein